MSIREHRVGLGNGGEISLACLAIETNKQNIDDTVLFAQHGRKRGDRRAAISHGRFLQSGQQNNL